MADKVAKVDVYRHIADTINGNSSRDLPPFPKRYFTYETSPGVRLVLRESEPEVVEYVHDDCLIDEILTYSHRELYENYEGFKLDHKNAKECFKVWKSTTSPLKDIKAIKWPYDEGLTFRKLPWIKSYEPTPTFNEMFSRISNARALRAFIGSLFFPESDMQQYIWLWSFGQTGKGSLCRFLYKVFEKAFSSQIPPIGGDRFWTSMIIGKRLVVFPDCNDQKFVTGGLFKSLTGGDPVRFEIKGASAGTVQMNAKYMFLSNERPSISSEKADMRRIIYCEMQPLKGSIDPQYDAKLWAEGGAFLSHCIGVYEADTENHGPISANNDEILGDWVSTVEEEFEVAFEKNFKISDDYILPVAFQYRLHEIWPRNKIAQRDFLSWLERTHGIKKKSRREGDQVIKVYSGLSMVYEGAVVDTSGAQQRDLQDSLEKSRQQKARSRLSVVDSKNEK